MARLRIQAATSRPSSRIRLSSGWPAARPSRFVGVNLGGGEMAGQDMLQSGSSFLAGTGDNSAYSASETIPGCTALIPA